MNLTNLENNSKFTSKKETKRSQNHGKSSKNQKGRKRKYVIFIGCIPGNVTNKDVVKAFGKKGDIFDIRLKKKKGNLGSGFGTFCTYSKKAFEDITGQAQSILGREITCRPYLQGKEKGEYLKSLHNRRIYLKNIPLRFSDDEIFKFFKKYGKIERAYAIRDRCRKSLGYGYVNFSTVQEAQNMLNNHREVRVQGKVSPILCLPYVKSDGFKPQNQVSSKNAYKNNNRNKNPRTFKNFYKTEQNYNTKHKGDESTRRRKKTARSEIISSISQKKIIVSQIGKKRNRILVNQKTDYSLQSPQIEEDLIVERDPQEEVEEKRITRRLPLVSSTLNQITRELKKQDKPCWMNLTLLRKIEVNHLGYTNLRMNRETNSQRLIRRS